jgi:hypothetical protein
MAAILITFLIAAKKQFESVAAAQAQQSQIDQAQAQAAQAALQRTRAKRM